MGPNVQVGQKRKASAAGIGSAETAGEAANAEDECEEDSDSDSQWTDDGSDDESDYESDSETDGFAAEAFGDLASDTLRDLLSSVPRVSVQRPTRPSGTAVPPSVPRKLVEADWTM